MELSKEELVFLKLFMFDAWFYCDVRNYSHEVIENSFIQSNSENYLRS